jgi:LacI family transcriptional regulator
VKKARRVTIHDIAKELDITASTVSRALQDHPRISKATKEAVLELARKYNYERNQMASSLRTGRTRTIGVIVPRINRHFFSSVIDGIESHVSSQGFQVLISQTQESYEREKASIQAMINANVDGIILSVSLETRDSDHVQEIIRAGLPLVMFDRILEDVSSRAVVLDDFGGAYQAVCHMLDMGCKRILHLGGPSHVNVYHERARGYVQAMNDRGAAEFVKIEDNTLTKQTGYQSILRLFESGHAFDGIFAASDYSALGAMTWLKENGVDVPGRVKVMGFANEPLTSFISPSLSTVEQHGSEMGKEAAKILLGGEKVEEESRILTINPGLVIRESTRGII